MSGDADAYGGVSSPFLFPVANLFRNSWNDLTLILVSYVTQLEEKHKQDKTKRNSHL